MMVRKDAKTGEKIFSCWRCSTKAQIPDKCPKCFNSGYKGRIGIFEFLPIDDQIRDMIALSGLTENIAEIRKRRIRTLDQSAFARVANGQTDFDEFERVCGPCR